MTSNLHTEILRRAAGVKNTSIGAAIGHDDGHISRILSGERGIRVCELDGFFDSLGLKVVPKETVHIDRQEYKAVMTLAAKYVLWKDSE